MRRKNFTEGNESSPSKIKVREPMLNLVVLVVALVKHAAVGGDHGLWWERAMGIA